MTQPELKSCPFCGNVKVHVGHLSESDIIADDWFVECDKPEGCGMSLYAIHRTRDKAIAAWNRRTADPVKQALAEALEQIVDHVEDMDLERKDLQCTLCHTYRMIGHKALDAYEKEQAQ